MVTIQVYFIHTFQNGILVMELANITLEELTHISNINEIRKIVMPVARELEDKYDYHRAELSLDAYLKAFGHFNGALLDGDYVTADEGYKLSDYEIAYWAFKSPSGYVALFACGEINVGHVNDRETLAYEIVTLLNKLYSVNFTSTQ